MSDHIDAIRKRRAALTGANQMPQLPFRIRWAESDTDFDGVLDAMGDEVCCVTHWGDTKPTTEFFANCPSDIDCLLAELALSQEYAHSLHDQLVRAEMAETRLTAEVERLQVSEQDLTLRLTASLGAEREGDQEIVRLQAEVERLRAVLNLVPLIRSGTDEEFAAALANVDADLQALTDTDQELGLYELADNPLIEERDASVEARNRLVKEQEIERLHKKQREERIAAVRADLSINFGYDGEQEDG